MDEKAMRSRTLLITVAMLVAALAAGCYPAAETVPTNAAPPDQAQTPVPAATSPAPAESPAPAQTSAVEPAPATPEYDPALQSLVAAAIQDLVQRLPAAPGDIEVVEAAAITWPDASLGCPQPDMRYKQVPVDGARIVLRVGKQTYSYHSGGSRAPFLCAPQPTPKDGLPKIDPIIPPPRSEDI